MPEYTFGREYGHDSQYNVKANSIDVAIKIFKADVLFPEGYVSNRYIKDREYIGGSMSYEYTYKKEPKIEIFINNRTEKKRKKVGEVTLAECINVNYDELLPGKDIKLLETTHIATKKDEQPAELPVIKNVHHVKTLDKQALRSATLEIEEKRRELETMMDEMKDSLKVIEEEIHQKLKLITAFELFLGVHEEIYELKKGDKAAEGEPITVYQQILYMDEEYGAWKNQGLDHEDIDKFDKWIAKNYDKYLYAEKSVCVFRVRRKKKDYSDNVFVDMIMNDGNWDTYFLIRNGENVYRMWAGKRIYDRLFPTVDEYEELLKEREKWGDGEKELQEKHHDYMLGLTYIQGLIERTEIFGKRFNNKVNLLTGHFTEKDIVLVRDDEQNKWLTDGKPSWDEFTKENRATIKLGTRIIIAEKPSFHREDKRTPFTYHIGSPRSKEIHLIARKEKGYYDEEYFIVLFDPEVEVYDKDTWEYHKRKRKVSYRLYRSEILNIDKITLEDIEYYLHNRLERHKYLEVLPALHYAKTVKIEEEKVESEFRLLVLGLMSWGAEHEDKVKAAVLWWKLKNKWRRPLAKDEAKAVRMIVNKLKQEIRGRRKPPIPKEEDNNG